MRLSTYFIALIAAISITACGGGGGSAGTTGSSAGTTTSSGSTSSGGTSTSGGSTSTSASTILSSAPSSLTLLVGNPTVSYTLSGGTQYAATNKYTVSSSFPALVGAVVEGSTLKITAEPNTKGGSSVVEVKDASGVPFTITVTVLSPDPLTTTAPSQVSMPNLADLSTVLSYAIDGGVKPYTVSSTNTNVVTVAQNTLGGAAYSLTSKGVGTATIQIEDAAHKIISVTATVPAAPLYTDAAANVTVSSNPSATNNQYTFNVSGGLGALSVASGNEGVAKVSAGTTAGSYKITGVSPGSTALSIKDAAGTPITIAVNVPAPDALYSNAPSTLQILSGSSRYYKIFGGVPGYVLSTTDISRSPVVLNSGVITNASISGDILVISAKVPGKQTISVSDAKGAVISIDVTVVDSLYTDAPSTVTLVQGTTNQNEYLIYGGVPYTGQSYNYKVVSDNESIATAVVTGDKLQITAKKPGTAGFKITDFNNSVISFTVTVVAPGALISTAPSSLTLANDSSSHGVGDGYVISGGVELAPAPAASTVPDYAAVTSNPALVTAEVLSGNLLRISSKPNTNGGTATITVSDGATPKNTLTVTVTVTAPRPLTTTAPSQVTMPAVGDTTKLSYAVLGGVAGSGYTVTSSAPDVVAVVDPSPTNPLTPLVTPGAFSLESKKPGTATITITDNAVPTNVITFTATVPALPLAIDAGSNVTVSADATASNHAYTINIRGGAGTYTAVSGNTSIATVVSGTVAQGFDGAFVLTGKAAGTTPVTIKDAAGTAITIAVNVPAPGALYTSAPATLKMLAGATNFYKVLGGTAPYTVKTIGQLDTTAVTEGKFAKISDVDTTTQVFSITAKAVGQQTFAISDANGLVTLIDVTVTTGMFTDSPAKQGLVVGTTSQSYTISGGTGTYKWVSSNPGIATAEITGSGPAGGTLKITGVSVGTATLTLGDANSPENVTLTVDVVAPGTLFSTAPGILNLAYAQPSASFVITGGVPDTAAPSAYTAVSDNPGLATASVTTAAGGSTFVVTPDAKNTVGGQATITLRDKVGNTLTLTVKVAPPAALFTTAPSTLAIAKGSSRTFAIVSGVESFTASSSSGVVASAQTAARTLTITGLDVGATTVRVTDSQGASVAIIVVVNDPATPLAVSAPTGLKLAAGAADTFDIVGGTPPYRVSSSSLFVAKPTMAGTNTQVQVEGMGAGTATITVTDQANATATFGVEVLAPSVLFSTAPATVYLSSTDVSYDIYGGSMSYAAVSSNAAVVTASVDTSGAVKLLKLHPVAGGTATVTLQDIQDNSKTISLTVIVGSSNGFFVSAPSAITIGAGPAPVYQISGGTKPYAVTSSDIRVTTGSIDSVSSALTINAWTVGTATLRVSDAVGQTYDIAVTVDGSTSASLAASIEVLTSNSNLPSSSTASVSFVVTVKDAQNRTVQGKAVSFSTATMPAGGNGGLLVGANPDPKTNSTGTVSGVSLAVGEDRSNRVISVTVTADSASKTFTVPVVGTTLTIYGSGSSVPGSTQTYKVRALDAAGRSISGATVMVASAQGATLSASSLATDSDGWASFNYTAPANAPAGGKDTLTVTGLGTSGTASVSLSSTNLSFSATTITNAVAWQTGTGVTSNAVTLQLTPPAVVNLLVASSRGDLRDSGGAVVTSVTTDASGQAILQARSQSSGAVTISAEVSGVAGSRTTLTGEFQAVTPSSVTLRSSTTSVPPNLVGSTTNQVALYATVMDAVGNPVKGKIVNFNINDVSLGNLSPVSVVTDANGVASSSYIPTTLTTSQNAVVVTATEAGTGLSGTTSLTVSSQAAIVSVSSTEPTILDSLTYKREFVAYLTNVNGVALPGQLVTLKVVPKDYIKGYLDAPIPSSATLPELLWRYHSPTKTCLNEDVNRNGILDLGEDTNGNGSLQPGMPATITSSAITDAQGFAKFNIRYGRSYAEWVNVDITATTSIGGFESSRTMSFGLDMTQADKENSSIPVNKISPFGVSSLCTDTL